VKHGAIPWPASLRLAWRRLRWEMDALSTTQLSAFLLIVLAFLIEPLLLTVYNTFTAGLEWFAILLNSPFYSPITVRYIDTFPYIAVSLNAAGQIVEWAGADTLYIRGVDLGVVGNTLAVGVSTATIATALGTGIAYVYARYIFPLKEAIRVLLLIPLLSTPFVGAIGLRRMLSADGPINVLFYEVLGLAPARIVFDGLAAMVLVQSLIFYPIVFLNAYAAFMSVDPTLEEQAENMGASGFKLFRTVTLPLALPGIEAGAILVFILSIEDLGTPIVIGGLAHKTLTYQIFDILRNQLGGGFNPLAGAMTVTLMVLSLAAFIAIRRYVSLRQYAYISKGGRWRPRARSLRPLASIPLIAALIMVALAGSMPQVSVTLLALTDEWKPGDLLPHRFTLKNYLSLLEDPGISRSIANSLIYSAAATAVIVLVGTGLAYIVTRKSIPGRGLLDFVATLPIALPGVVIAGGLFYAFVGTPLSPLLNPAPLLVVAYIIRKMPFTVRSVVAGLQQTHIALEEAARSVGAGRARTMATIVIPLILANILAGALLSFVYSMSEVSSSLVFGGFKGGTYAPMTWKMLDILSQLGFGLHAAAAMGTVLMGLQLLAIVVSTGVMKARVEAVTGV